MLIKSSRYEVHLLSLFHLIVVGAIAFNINVRSIDDEQLQEVLNCEIEGRVSISLTILPRRTTTILGVGQILARIGTEIPFFPGIETSPQQTRIHGRVRA